MDETDRHELWLSLCDTLGESRANTLMSMLSLRPIPDLAALRSDFGELRSHFVDLRTEVQTDLLAIRSNMGGMRSELKGEFSDIRGELSALRGELRAETTRTAILLGASLAVVIIAMTGLILTIGLSGGFAT